MEICFIASMCADDHHIDADVKLVVVEQQQRIADVLLPKQTFGHALR